MVSLFTLRNFASSLAVRARPNFSMESARVSDMLTPWSHAVACLESALSLRISRSRAANHYWQAVGLWRGNSTFSRLLELDWNSLPGTHFRFLAASSCSEFLSPTQRA